MAEQPSEQIIKDKSNSENLGPPELPKNLPPNSTEKEKRAETSAPKPNGASKSPLPSPNGKSAPSDAKERKESIR